MVLRGFLCNGAELTVVVLNVENRNRYILFTNIHNIWMGDFRFFGQALVLEQFALRDDAHPRYRVRGFKTDAALEIFDLSIKSLEHGVKVGKCNTVITLEDGRELTLHHADCDQPLDVEEFDGPLPTWEALRRKVAKYWQAPAMPVAHYMKADIVRQVTEDNAPEVRAAMGLPPH